MPLGSGTLSDARRNGKDQGRCQRPGKDHRFAGFIVDEPLCSRLANGGDFRECAEVSAAEDSENRSAASWSGSAAAVSRTGERQRPVDGVRLRARPASGRIDRHGAGIETSHLRAEESWGGAARIEAASAAERPAGVVGDAEVAAKSGEVGPAGSFGARVHLKHAERVPSGIEKISLPAGTGHGKFWHR